MDIVDKGFIESEDEEALSDVEKKVLVDNRKGTHALNQINLAIDKGVYEKSHKATTSKQAWEILQNAYKGDEQVKHVQLQILRAEFENLEMKENDNVVEYFTKIDSIVNQMASNGEALDDLRTKGLKLSKHDEGKLINPTMFRSLVANLMYSTATRPDIAYVVKGALDYGIFYQASVPVNLIGYTNSDLARSIDDIKSASSYVFDLGSGIAWCSKKWSTIALSITEA
ncbi:hypothetical protein ZIOFF_015392 [Zingiber officinale]|uniref:Uncharacterized protein n=1 Tax=Zingiber officinale TaxID=94328 RepID=A0A8J5LW95_ZINOF|nr:hypothetical protein ZIOFF_015392 [Zingiber officinale]